MQKSKYVSIHAPGAHTLQSMQHNQHTREWKLLKELWV